MVAQPKASCHILRKTWPSMVVPRCKLGISFLRSLLSDFSSIRMTCVLSFARPSQPRTPLRVLHYTSHSGARAAGRVTRYSYLDAKSNREGIELRLKPKASAAYRTKS